MNIRDLINKMNLLKEGSNNDNYKIDEINNLLFEKINNDELHSKYYSNIPIEDFNKIIEADPTRKKDGSAGKYSKWLLSLYLNKKLKIEDLYKATEYLTYFAKYGGKLKMNIINQYKSLSELYNALKHIIDSIEGGSDEFKSNSEKAFEVKQGAEKPYEDSEWIIIIPRTEEASCYYGAGTQWCTAAKNNNQFKSYNDDGDLLILINKSSGDKYQFHKESDSYMDSSDSSLDLPLKETLMLNNSISKFLLSKGIDVNFNDEFGEYKLVMDGDDLYVQIGDDQFILPYKFDDYDDYYVKDYEGDYSDNDFFVINKEREPQFIIMIDKGNSTIKTTIFKEKIYSIDMYHENWLYINNSILFNIYTQDLIDDFEDFEAFNYTEVGNVMMVLGDDTIYILQDNDVAEYEYPDGTNYMSWDEIKYENDDDIVILESNEQIATLNLGEYEEDWDISDI